uniref:Protein kinase domain-containing protein n=2 Tax=Leersia perrieri TaxID=77586 RepID=A0A0D9Y0U7_9ORYZ
MDTWHIKGGDGQEAKQLLFFQNMDIPEGKCFSKREIGTITSEYKTMIGQGAFGEVYRGTLQDGSMVAVKKINLTAGHRIKENFVKEVSIHSQINHQSVTRLIGYCFEEDALMMVIEYISGGNLSDFLHNNDRPLCLGTRLRIATECAEALCYMHSYMHARVIHGDIKPANILLDQHLNAKISDFGISRLINTDKTLYTHYVMGSIGYMDPLFAQDGRLTTKSDVYSFGVVLVELITRKRPRSEDGKKTLVESFTSSPRDMFDKEIVDQSNMKVLEGIGKLAGECLLLDNLKRPEMTDVAERLWDLRKDLDRREEKMTLFFWPTKNKTTVVAPASNPAAITKLVRLGSAAVAPLQLEVEDLLSSSAEVLGNGVLGTTYKVKLESKITLVVKRLKSFGDYLLSTEQREFERRATAIGAIDNKLVLPLRCYGFIKDEKLLVYDYMPMGSLASSSGRRAGISWERRSTIALTVARSLAAIHSAGEQVCHGNIKSSNVFLTQAYGARLSEHGFPTLLAASPSLPRLSMSWYHAPEVTDIRCLSQKADIYSLGVLLRELFTGKLPEALDRSRSVKSVAIDEWISEDSMSPLPSGDTGGDGSRSSLHRPPSSASPPPEWPPAKPASHKDGGGGPTPSCAFTAVGGRRCVGGGGQIHSRFGTRGACAPSGAVGRLWRSLEVALEVVGCVDLVAASFSLLCLWLAALPAGCGTDPRRRGGLLVVAGVDLMPSAGSGGSGRSQAAVVAGTGSGIRGARASARSSPARIWCGDAKAGVSPVAAAERPWLTQTQGAGMAYWSSPAWFWQFWGRLRLACGSDAGGGCWWQRFGASGRFVVAGVNLAELPALFEVPRKN